MVGSDLIITHLGKLEFEGTSSCRANPKHLLKPVDGGGVGEMGKLLIKNHSRLQSPRSFCPAVGIERSGSNQFRHAPYIDVDCVKPDGQNLVISFVISKWLLPELSFSDRWSRGMRLWERD